MVQKNKIILVTGASSGLGLAVATHLSETGYIVYAGARSFSNDTSEDGTLKKIHLDVTDQAGIDSTVKKIIETEGRIDVLINCAAIQVLGSVEDLTWEEFENVFLTNTGGVVRMCKAVLPFMRNRNEGQIINFSSIMGLVAVPFQSAYTASKFAVEGFTETLRMETGIMIKVSMVEPQTTNRFCEIQAHTAAADLLSSPYYDLFRKVTAKIEYDEAHGSEPEKTGQTYRRIASQRPRRCYMSGKFDRSYRCCSKKILPGKCLSQSYTDIIRMDRKCKAMKMIAYTRVWKKR